MYGTFAVFEVVMSGFDGAARDGTRSDRPERLSPRRLPDRPAGFASAAVFVGVAGIVLLGALLESAPIAMAGDP